MMMFIDTSAILAVLDADDPNHARAKLIWQEAVAAGDGFVCHNYILVECLALISRRLGMEAARVFELEIVPVLRVEWITREIHNAAAGAHLVAGRRTLSLVDCASFEVMRRMGLEAAFAFDRHFRENGYRLI
jgi:predicted nucleic acid-binding protein